MTHTRYIMKKSFRENAPAPAPAAPAAPAPAPAAPAPAAAPAESNLSASGKKLQDRLDKIPGLGELMGGVTKLRDAAAILVAIAKKLGGDKVAASAALTAALNIAKKEEKLNEHAEKRVQAFVRYLFE